MGRGVPRLAVAGHGRGHAFCRSMAGRRARAIAGPISRPPGVAGSLPICAATTRVLATGATLSEAEAEALNREISLQLQFVPDLPPCRRVVTIDAGRSTIVSSLRIPPARTNFSVVTPGGR